MAADTDARFLRSRRALLDAGVHALLQNPQASLSQIAQHAGVGRATLYRHFETREQLIQALAIESLEMTEQAMAPIKRQGLTGLKAIEAMFEAILPLANRYRFILSLWSIAEEDEQVQLIYQQQISELMLWIDQGKRNQEIDPSLDSMWLATLIDSAIYGLWWMQANTPLSDAELIYNARQSLVNGFAYKAD